MSPKEQPMLVKTKRDTLNASLEDKVTLKSHTYTALLENKASYRSNESNYFLTHPDGLNIGLIILGSILQLFYTLG